MGSKGEKSNSAPKLIRNLEAPILSLMIFDHVTREML